MFEKEFMTNLDFLWCEQRSVTNTDWSHLLHCNGWQVRHHFDLRDGLWTKGNMNVVFNYSTGPL